MIFFSYPVGEPPSLKGYYYLSMEGEPLTSADSDSGLFIIDGTWRYAERMERWCQKNAFFEGAIPRTLPKKIKTAYPRRQEDCTDPEHGLASVEALFIAYAILGRPLDGILEGYRWKETFLALNPEFK